MSELVLRVPETSCEQGEQALTTAPRPLPRVKGSRWTAGQDGDAGARAAFRVDAALAAVEHAGQTVAILRDRP